jgi:hypothetical protein
LLSLQLIPEIELTFALPTVQAFHFLALVPNPSSSFALIVVVQGYLIVSRFSIAQLHL